MKLRGVVLAIALAACGNKDKPADKTPPPPPPTDKPPPPTDKAPPPADNPPAGDDSPQLAANAPKDRVASLNAQREARIAELTVEAKKTWPGAKARYLKGLPKGQVFFVAAKFTDGPARETGFVAVKSIKGGKITGTVATQLEQVKTIRNGDPYTLDEADIVDWLISMPDGSEEGNLVGKYLDSQLGQ